MIKVYVMESCPDCRAVKALAQTDPRFKLIDIGEHVANLKEFIRLRDARPEFDEAKQGGWIGIPCFCMEDGSITFSHPDADFSDIETDSACRLDGTGC
ncbi:MAG: glutaredoxin-related protein [Prevotellaceae bacterium]|nr:glutaredoxin-related protein [Prevotellaceae bacterium]